MSLTGIANSIFGVTQPINSANDFVLAPLTQIVAPYDPKVASAIQVYEAAGGSLQPGVSADQLVSDQQATWLKNYTDALAKGSVENGT